MPIVTPLRILLVLVVVSLVSVQLFAVGPADAATSPEVFRFDGGRDDTAHAITTDSSGNIYVAARVEDSSKPSTFAVLKYNPQGALQLVARYSGSQGGVGGSIASVAIDAGGNIYAAGSIQPVANGPSTIANWLVVKFRPDGSEQWVRKSSVGANDRATKVIVDSSGNAYVIGTTATAGADDWRIVKYATDGAVLWERQHNGTVNWFDRPVDLKLDPAGNLVVAGTADNFRAGFGSDIITQKYDPQGNKLWEAIFFEPLGTSEHGDHVVGEMDIDSSGNIYITGTNGGGVTPEAGVHPHTLKYDSNGNLQFVLRGDGAGGSSIAVDHFGDILLSGASADPSGATVATTTKVDRLGNRIWQLPGIVGQLATDSTGNVYLSSNTQTFTMLDRSDYVTTKFDRNGAKLWEHRFDGSSVENAVTQDMPVGLSVDGLGNALVTGTVSEGTSSDIVTLKFPAGLTPGPNPTPTPAPLAAPSNLSASAVSARQIDLRWQDNSSSETGFKIERCQGSGCTNFTQIALVGANVTSFSNTGLAKNTTYRYRVRAFSGSTNSAFSNIVAATTLRR